MPHGGATEAHSAAQQPVSAAAACRRGLPLKQGCGDAKMCCC